jgi:hypothetical protein
VAVGRAGTGGGGSSAFVADADGCAACPTTGDAQMRRQCSVSPRATLGRVHAHRNRAGAGVGERSVRARRDCIRRLCLQIGRCGETRSSPRVRMWRTAVCTGVRATFGVPCPHTEPAAWIASDDIGADVSANETAIGAREGRGERTHGHPKVAVCQAHHGRTRVWTRRRAPCCSRRTVHDESKPETERCAPDAHDGGPPEKAQEASSASRWCAGPARVRVGCEKK